MCGVTYVTDQNLSSQTQMNNQLEMLSQREQLMEDIDAIITSQYLNDKIDEDDMEDLIRMLCDAVCKNFPTK